MTAPRGKPGATGGRGGGSTPVVAESHRHTVSSGGAPDTSVRWENALPSWVSIASPAETSRSAPSAMRKVPVDFPACDSAFAKDPSIASIQPDKARSSDSGCAMTALWSGPAELGARCSMRPTAGVDLVHRIQQDDVLHIRELCQRGLDKPRSLLRRGSCAVS